MRLKQSMVAPSASKRRTTSATRFIWAESVYVGKALAFPTAMSRIGGSNRAPSTGRRSNYAVSEADDDYLIEEDDWETVKKNGKACEKSTYTLQHPW